MTASARSPAVDTSPEFFETLYQGAEDPWGFASSPYEQHRYQTLIELLGGARFRRGFEPGCGEGELTASLALQCDQLNAVDASPSAVKRAQQRFAQCAHIDVHCGVLPGDIPGTDFDFIVFSELGYYFDARPLAQLVQRLSRRLTHGGTFLSCHWLGSSADHRLPGDEAHAIVQCVLGPCTRTVTSGRDGQRFKAAVWHL